MIRNHMEDFVKELLTLVLRGPDYKDVCRCEKCMDDILAVTLNHIKPAYFRTTVGKVYSVFDEKSVQNKNDILVELIRSIELIKNNPHHDMD